MALGIGCVHSRQRGRAPQDELWKRPEGKEAKKEAGWKPTRLVQPKHRSDPETACGTPAETDELLEKRGKLRHLECK